MRGKLFTIYRFAGNCTGEGSAHGCRCRAHRVMRRDSDQAGLRGGAGRRPGWGRLGVTKLFTGI
jgi:hypothetical protein